MVKTSFDVYRCCFISILAFGILGNVFVIISILRQKKVWANNYYFLVLHLGICDLGALIIYLLNAITSYWIEKPPAIHSFMYCLVVTEYYVFQIAGIGMMLIISVLRYRATVHPLKPAISRRKLKVVCGLVYLASLIAGNGVYLPECFLLNDDNPYWKFRNACSIFFFYVPTIFLGVAYYKIARALMKQKRQMKIVCSNPVRQGAPSSSFNIRRYIRNRRTFFVCLITVLCYGVGNIPLSVRFMLIIAEEYHLLKKYFWIKYLAGVLRIAGSHAANALIYGILDKKLLTFWKLCRKKIQRPQES